MFPGLEEEREKRKAIHAHRDLLELFDAAVARATGTGSPSGGWRASARSASPTARCSAGRRGWAASCSGRGVKHGDRVMLVSENRPGVGHRLLRHPPRRGDGGAGGPASSTEAEVVNIVRRSEARVVLLSEDAARDLAGLWRALSDQALDVQLATLAQAMEGDVTQPDRIGAVRKSAAPDDVASLIFTSGTTGNPKGVMLTHRNFASLVAKLAASFDFGVGDGLLSVLPLHHTFEFSAGLLMPFSRGAEITYLDELTTDRLGEVLEAGHVTAMIGVPGAVAAVPPQGDPGAGGEAGHRRAGDARR